MGPQDPPDQRDHAADEREAQADQREDRLDELLRGSRLTTASVRSGHRKPSPGPAS